MIYLETSALLKLYIREAGSEFVQTQVFAQDHPLPVWDLQHAEVTNALRLKVFWGDLESQLADELIALFNERLSKGQYFTPDLDRDRLMRDFRELSRRTPETGCRTLDILHVACALQLDPERFLSYDDRQRALAAAVGLSVLPAALPA